MSLDLKKLISKLNPYCLKAIEEAADFCFSKSNFNVEIEHLLLKILDMHNSDICLLISCHDVSLSIVSRELMQSVDRLKSGNRQTPSFSSPLQLLIQEAWLLTSLKFGENQIRSGALLMVLLTHNTLRGVLRTIVPSLLRIPTESLQKELLENIGNSAEGSGDFKTKPGSNVEDSDDRNGSDLKASKLFKSVALDQYTVDLLEHAKNGLIDPINGRETEIRQIIDVLTRRRQNNPILVGDAGVGKTAVVEGFAFKILENDVPPSLQNISLRTLDLTLMQAGAGVKGEFENRLKSIISEVKASPQPIILFIDEAHTMIGAGGSAGQGDAANILKPALARGELRTIAATTWAEYKKYFEKDAALARRFQLVKVNEPDEDTAVAMIRHVVPSLEKHHNVRILDEAVHDAVKLSHRYISGRQLPDKAISVLDTACARVAIGQNATPSEVEDVTQRIEILNQEIHNLEREELYGTDHNVKLDEITEEVTKHDGDREELVKRWKHELELVQRINEIQDKLEKTAAGYDDNEDEEIDIVSLKKELKQLQWELEDTQWEKPMVPACVNSSVIASVISGWTGIPMGKMLANEVDTILGLKKVLSTQVIGQEHAINTICDHIQISRAGLSDREKPVGVFLLAGPTGVGKTETAIALAENLYGGLRNLVTLNMTEYQESYAVSGLKGSPPGYVGYGQGGVLTEAVRRNPYSVVLLDEIEKAHPDVMELFFQVFDKGCLEDSEGVNVDFKNTLIILTSNVAEDILNNYGSDFKNNDDIDKVNELIRPELVKHFKSAFLGRLIIVPYFMLGECEMQKIVELKFDNVVGRFKESHNVELTCSDSVISSIAMLCSKVDSGARSIEHFLTQSILPRLSEELLKRISNVEGCESMHVYMDDGGYFAYSCVPELNDTGSGDNRISNKPFSAYYGETSIKYDQGSEGV